MNRNQFEQKAAGLQRQVEEQKIQDEREHRSQIEQIRNAHDSRIKEFENAHQLRMEKREARLKEEIALRKSLAELQATNQEYIPRFIEHLIHWESFFQSLRNRLDNPNQPIEPPTPLE